MTLMETRAGPMTRADLEHTPDDGRRYELLDGVLIVSPAPIPWHQVVLKQLMDQLDEACPEDLLVLPAPVDVVFDDHTVLEPDILVVRRSDIGRRELAGLPLLAVEVLSPSTRRFDLMTKRSRYEAGGIGAYWVVDPDGRELIGWELRDGAYEEVARLAGDGTFSTDVPFPLTIDVGRLGPDVR